MLCERGELVNIMSNFVCVSVNLFSCVALTYLMRDTYVPFYCFVNVGHSIYNGENIVLLVDNDVVQLFMKYKKFFGNKLLCTILGDKNTFDVCRNNCVWKIYITTFVCGSVTMI